MTEPKFEVLVDTKPEAFTEALAAPKEQQRFLYYSKKIRGTWWYVSYTEFEEQLIYRESELELKMGKALYPKHKSKKGFTFDKKTKKVTLWYGASVNNLINLPRLLTAIGKEWVINEGFNNWMTKGLLEKVLANKITNPRDAAKYLIGVYRFKNISPKALQKYIKEGISKIQILSVAYVTDDLRLYFGNNYHISPTPLLHDLLRQAKILDRKINFGWSPARVREVHKDWTREIMKMELDMIEPELVHYKYLKEFEGLLPSNFELIRDRQRLFAEGVAMDHCVYTNYWDSVKSKNYMVLHIEQDGDLPVTAGIRIRKKEFSDHEEYGIVDQVYGLRNSVYPTEETKEQLDKLVYSEAFQDLLKREFFGEYLNEPEETNRVLPVAEYEEIEEEELLF